MDEDEDGKAGKLAEIELLCVRALGQAMPDKLVEWLGVGRRSAERWLSGALSWPDPVVGKLREQADHADALYADLEALAKKYKTDGMHENLIKMRIKDYARDKLSDAPPAKEPPRRKSDDA